MSPAIQFAGKDHVLQVFGIPLVGITPANGKKLLLSVVFILGLVAANRLLHWIARCALGKRIGRVHFWVKQAIRLISAALLITGVVSIWFNDPARLASAAAF